MPLLCGHYDREMIDQVQDQDQRRPRSRDRAEPPTVTHGAEADRLVLAAETSMRTGSLTEAVSHLRDALNHAPKHLRACQLLAMALELQGRRADATEAWLSVGVALESLDQLDHAADTYRKVIARKPDCVRAHNKLGWVLLKLAKPHEAMRCFESAIAIDPESEQLHKRLGCAALMANDEERGWQEWGWRDGLLERHRFEQPAWDGDVESLKGRTILTWSEFALGDSLQCLRYLSLLAQHGAKVVVEIQSTLVPLVQRMPSVSEVVASGAPLPPFDIHAPLFSLAPAFQKERLGAGIPYVEVGDDLIATWRNKLAPIPGKRHIGLTWAGSPTGSNNRYRHTSLSSYAPLAGVKDARYISLQLGPRAADLHNPPAGLEIEPLLDESCTAADTAALMMNLDLIISIDSMVAHLAGALARPVWCVTWLSPAWWLWHSKDDHSLWYPTMRLFQQIRAGDWQDVLVRVRAALETHR